MLWRLIVRLLFKASLPLVAVAGVFTYGVYLKGGDPAALWQGIGARGLAQVEGLIAGVRQDTSDAMSSAGRVATDALQGRRSATAAAQDGSGLTEVFTWKDAQGVTHYSTSKPEGIAAGTVSVDPNVNVLAPFADPSSDRQHDDHAADRQSGRVRKTSSGSLDEEPLPGVAGQVLATRRGGSNAQAEAGGQSQEGLADIDPTQLLRMLQQGER